MESEFLTTCVGGGYRKGIWWLLKGSADTGDVQRSCSHITPLYFGAPEGYVTMLIPLSFGDPKFKSSLCVTTLPCYAYVSQSRVEALPYLQQHLCSRPHMEREPNVDGLLFLHFSAVQRWWVVLEGFQSGSFNQICM